MMKKIAGCVLGGVAGVVALAGAPTTGIAQAAPMVLPVDAAMRVTDPCRGTAPDATVNWGANQVSVGADSPNMDYAAKHPACPAYVVQFNVTAETAKTGNSEYAPPVSFGGDDPARDQGITVYTNGSAQECATYQQQVLVYKQAAGQSGFTFVGGGWYRGSWQTGFPYGAAGGCALVQEAGFVPIPAFNTPSSGTDSYKVAVDAVIFNPAQHAHVRAFGRHVLTPPT